MGETEETAGGGRKRHARRKARRGIPDGVERLAWRRPAGWPERLDTGAWVEHSRGGHEGSTSQAIIGAWRGQFKCALAGLTGRVLLEFVVLFELQSYVHYSKIMGSVSFWETPFVVDRGRSNFE